MHLLDLACSVGLHMLGSRRGKMIYDGHKVCGTELAILTSLSLF
jgi:hypothetical protein